MKVRLLLISVILAFGGCANPVPAWAKAMNKPLVCDERGRIWDSAHQEWVVKHDGQDSYLMPADHSLWRKQ
jgi:hypothetical protein